MDLFSRKGFAGTTTKEIALAAGVSEAIIFRHFATKRDLYTAIIEHNIHSAEARQVLAGLEDCMKRQDDEGLFRLIMLLPADGGGGDAASVIAGGVQRKRTPSGTDFEDVIVRSQTQFAADPVELLHLGFFE